MRVLILLLPFLNFCFHLPFPNLLGDGPPVAKFLIDYMLVRSEIGFVLQRQRGISADRSLPFESESYWFNIDHRRYSGNWGG